jgi:hypothetical protein
MKTDNKICENVTYLEMTINQNYIHKKIKKVIKYGGMLTTIHFRIFHLPILYIKHTD